MSAPDGSHLDRVLVVYALDDPKARPAGAPFAIAPRALHGPLRAEVAPGRVTAMYAIADAARIFAGEPNVPEDEREKLRKLLDWTDEVEGIYALYQLEPPQTAGRGIAGAKGR